MDSLDMELFVYSLTGALGDSQNKVSAFNALLLCYFSYEPSCPYYWSVCRRLAGWSVGMA